MYQSHISIHRQYHASGVTKPRRRPARARRGSAEIEALFAFMLFLSLIFLSRGAMRIGLARLATSEKSAFNAFHDAISADPPAYDNQPSMQPVTSYIDIRPGLPNRVHAAREASTISERTGETSDSPMTVTVGAQAALPGPAWAFSAYPNSADSDLHADWFENYVAESHEELIDPLGLAPAWTP